VGNRVGSLVATTTMGDVGRRVISDDAVGCWVGGLVGKRLGPTGLGPGLKVGGVVKGADVVPSILTVRYPVTTR